MNNHSKVFVAAAVACAALVSGPSARAVVLDLAPAEATNAGTSEASSVNGYYSFVIDSGQPAPLTLDAVSSSSGSQGSNLVALSAVAAAIPPAAASSYAALGSSSTASMGGQPATGFRDFQVARIIVIPEVTALLPLAGVLGLVFGGRHLRRPRRLAQA